MSKSVFFEIIKLTKPFIIIHAVLHLSV